MKRLLILPILCGIHFFVRAQTISDITYTINWQQVSNAVPVGGKGIYLLAKEGLVLFEPATSKYKLFNQTDSNKTVAGLTGLAIYKDLVYVHSAYNLYQLQSNGLLKEVPLPFKTGGSATLRHVAISVNEITATSGDKLFTYEKNGWRSVTLPDVRFAKYSKVFPAGYNKYFALRESGSVLVLYDPATKTERELARTYNTPIIFHPEQAATWYLLDDGIEYFAFKNRVVYSSFDVNNYPGKTKLTLQNTKAFNGCRLMAGDRQDIYFMSADTVLQLSTTVMPNNRSAKDTFIQMVLQKVILKPASPKTGSEFVVYGSTVYEFGAPGIVRRTMLKTDTIYTSINRSIAIEGYNQLMPNGYLYTKVATKLYWNNGNSSGSKDFGNYVLDMTTDGKTNFFLTEKILYREMIPGGYDSVASVANNAMKTVAVDKNGTIWMAGPKGITTISNGKEEFIPSASITKFRKNQAVHAIAVSPEGEIYFSMNKVYKYKDKALTEIPGSPSLVYRHYFDGNGNDYMAGIGECFFYDGREAKDMKKILMEAYPDKKAPYVGAVAIDPQGRCWAIVNFLNQNGIVVFDKGKPVNFIAGDKLILDPFKQKMFSYKQQMIIATEKGGWITLQYK